MENIRLPHIHNKDAIEIIENIPDTVTFFEIADIFSLISDPTRLKILWLLCHLEECVSNIAAVVQMSSPAVSHHLKILRQADILYYRRDGKEAYYSLAKTRKAKLVHEIIDILFDEKI